MEDLIKSRVHDPDRALRVAQRRRRRGRLAPDGRLNIVATDHPARRVTKIGDRPLAMADRQDLLARIVRVLMSEGVDGVMATMDVIEELLILHDLSHLSGGASFLDEKVLIGSMNRGGLAGTAWEMDDPVTGATPATCAQWNLDGAKFLLRICDDDRDSLKTILAYAGKVLTHKFLLQRLWDEPADPQYLRVYVRQLRQKIEIDPERPRYLLTETGVGYRLRAPD
jgi:hypothetical protein